LQDLQKNAIGNSTKVKSNKQVNHVHETQPILSCSFIFPS